MFKASHILTLGLVFPSVLLACSGGGDARKEITEVKEVPQAEVAAIPKMSTKERLGLTQAPGAHDHGSKPEMAASGEQGGTYGWELPEGWEDRGATQMRLANVGLSGQPEVECSFSALGGDGGGLAANLNRWRKQLSLEPYTPEEIEALPKKTLLGKEAIYTVMDGSYGGMGDQPVKENWRLLGLTLIHEGTAYFVKMTGPAALLADQEEKFLAFAASIHESGDSGAAVSAAPDVVAPGTAIPEGHPPVGEVEASGSGGALPEGHPPVPATGTTPAPMASDGGASSGGYHWAAPEGWVKGPDKPMREVTFTVNGAECYVSLLGGMAGGVEANINRWFGQMGQQPLSAEAVKALPTITVLGIQAPMAEIKGTYSGMSGEGIPNQMMLGVVCSLENQSLFVKMTGPEEVVTAQASNFVAFCESIHQ